MDDENESQGQSGGHPAWQSILDAVPEELHPILRPQLEEWDKGVQTKLQGLHDQYAPYKPLVDNKVDMDFVDQAIYLAQQMQENPQDVVQRAIESFELPYELRNALENKVGNNVGMEAQDEWDGVDITKHPQYQALQGTVETLNSEWTQRKADEEAAKQQTQMQSYIETLHKSPDGKEVAFDDLYVATMLAAGLDGPTAVKQYQETVNTAAAALAEQYKQSSNQQTQQFTVLGGESGGGSGVPNEQPNFGKMGKSDLNAAVMQILANAKNA